MRCRKPRVLGTLPGPKASRLLSKQRELESTAVWYPKLVPLVPRSASGPWIEDVDGNVFLDLTSMAGALALGHGSCLVDEFTSQSRKLMTALDFPTEPRIKFLEAITTSLAHRLSWQMKCHLTGPTGADAVEAALKLARWKTQKPTVVFLEGAYHGMTAGAASVSDLRGPLTIPGHAIARVAKATFPLSENRVETCVRELEGIISHCKKRRTEVGAMIIEPIQGEGGVRSLPLTYLPLVQNVLREHGALLIVDEVQTGFGRCGTLFSIEDYGVCPDILVFSKAASGVGAPLGGIAFSASLDGWPPGSHVGTFRGFAPSLSSGTELLQTLCGTEILRDVARNGATLVATLAKRLSGCPSVGEIRGKGYMIGIEIVKEGQPDPLGARRVVTEFFEAGLITELGGTEGNVVRLLPPLNIPVDCLKLAVEIITRLLSGKQPTKKRRRASRA